MDRYTSRVLAAGRERRQCYRGVHTVRGAAFLLPIVVIYVLVTSSSPLFDLARVAGFLLIAILAGALSGLMYSFVARHLRRFGAVGFLIAPRPYGLVDTLTYVVAPLPIAFVAKSQHVYGPDNPVTVMGLAGPDDDMVRKIGPTGSHVTV